MDLVDTHCHLHFDDFLADPEGVIERAHSAGVKKMICVGVSLADSRKAVAFAAKHTGIWASVGIHPYGAKDLDTSSEQELKKLLNMLRVVAVGEIGLDYHRPDSDKDSQRKALRAQIKIGLEQNLPMIFHVRDAWTDFWQILDENQDIRGLVHSFTGGPKQLEQALSRGLYVALNGIVTFTKDAALLDAAKQIPLDKLVLETDAPFLTPTGAEEQVCEPKHVRLVAEFLAGLRGEDLKQLAAATSQNASRLFGLETPSA